MSPKKNSATYRLFLIAIWFGLVGGLLEGTVRVLLGYFLNPFRGGTDVSPQFLWIASICGVFLFVVIACFLLPVIALLRNRKTESFALGLFVGLAAFSVLSSFEKFADWSSASLALGFAALSIRWFLRHEQKGILLLRNSLIPIVLIVTLIYVVSLGWERLQRGSDLQRTPIQSRVLPNVLLITLDTLRADHLSTYGYERPTSPNIDRIAQRSVVFENAFATSSWTLPSHASLFTGLWAHETGTDWLVPLDRKHPTLAEVLKSKGYATAGFAANLHYCGKDSGLARGFAHYEDLYGSFADMFVRTAYGKALDSIILKRLGFYNIPGRKSAKAINESFLSWLNENRHYPFFVFLNYFDAHDPYLPPETSRVRFSTAGPRKPIINHYRSPKGRIRMQPSLSPEEIRREIDAYDEAIAYLDEQIGFLFAQLDELGLAENTLVILTSDHGESLGDHDLFGHGNSLYFETVRVPLIIRYPGKVLPGLRVSSVVSLRDVPATVMHLLGVSPDSPFPGKSMAHLWSEETTTDSLQSEPVLISAGRTPGALPSYPTKSGGLISLVSSKWQFILKESNETEMYDLQNDRAELQNIAGTAAAEKVSKEFKSKLQAMLSRRRSESDLP